MRKSVLDRGLQVIERARFAEPFLVRSFLVGRFLIPCAISFAVGSWAFAESAVSVYDTFEPDTGFLPGDSVDLHPDWCVFGQGEAVITANASGAGSQSLRLKAGEPIAHAARSVPASPVVDGTSWVTFRILRASPRIIGSLPDDGLVLTSLSVFGAKVGFVEIDGTGTVVAFDKIAEEPVATGLRFSDGQNSEAPWLTLTYEIADAQWRLHDGNGPASQWFGLDGIGGAIHWFGDPLTDIFIDDLQVVIGGNENPFDIEPENTEQMPSAESFSVERANAKSLRDLTEESGPIRPSGNVSSRVRDTGFLTVGNASTIYVSGEGNDANDGLTLQTAKATIAAAIAATVDGGEVIVAPKSGGYAGGSISTGGKKVTLRTLGLVILR